jgi:hypothetical protein
MKFFIFGSKKKRTEKQTIPGDHAVLKEHTYDDQPITVNEIKFGSNPMFQVKAEASHGSTEEMMT